MLRKPYVIGDFMYSNGVRKYEVEKFNADGYLTHSSWAANLAKGHYSDTESIEAADLRKGELMFREKCGACHTENGCRAMKNLLKDRNEKAIGNILQMLHENKDDSPYRKYMPPLVGKDDEIKALAAYLKQISTTATK